MMTPTLTTACAALPPEGALASWERPGDAHAASRLVRIAFDAREFGSRPSASLM